MKKISVLKNNDSFAKQTVACHPELVLGSEVGETKSTPLSNSLPWREERNAFPRPLRERVSVGRVRGQRAAFTLAEVLITLGIIGVVAAIVMPSLITNVNDRVREKRIQNIKQKFSKATDKMLVTSGLNNYASTEAFVKELQKHFKIAKVCDNSNIDKCWPTDTVKLEDGKEWDISKTKTGKTLKMKNDDNQEWDDTMAFITADGTSYIVSYNKKCNQDESKSITWSGDQSTTTNCTAMVFDWNGGSKPNTFRKDIIAFNANGLGSSCALEIDGKCFGAPFTPTPMTKAECEAAVAEGKLGIKYCYYYYNDYWAGAVKECGGVSNMPTASDLQKIASLLYDKPITSNSDTSATYNGKAPELGFPDLNSKDFYVWSGEESGTDGNYAYRRYFSPTYTYWSDDSRDYNSFVLCLGD